MVNYTAQPLYDPFVDAVDHTLDGTYIGQGGTQVIAGVDPEPAETGSTATSNRVGFAAESGRFTTTLDKPYLNGAPTQVVVGLNPEPTDVHAAGERLTVPRSGTFDRALAGATVDHDLAGEGNTYIGAGFDPGPTIGTMNPEGAAIASYIPMASFRLVTGQVVDESGEPITRAKFIFAKAGFQTATSVDETGQFQLVLLRTDYDDFGLTVAPNPDPEDPDMVWELASETVIGPTDEEAKLPFQSAEIEAETLGGLFVGAGASFGG